MISLRNLLWVGLLGASLQACGSDDSGGVNPSDCAAVAAKQKSLAAAVGCKDASAGFQTACSTLYAAKICTNEWAAAINCISPRPSSDFECDPDDNTVSPKAGVCTAEETAFQACVDKASP